MAFNIIYETTHEPEELAANWVLELLDAREALQAVTDTTVTMEDISSFQERVAKPSVSDFKSNISSRFASQDVVSCFSIFDSRKIPSLDSSELCIFLWRGCSQDTT